MLWNSRNHLIKGEKLQEPCALNRREADLLKESQIQQTHVPRMPDACPVDLWQPPPTHIYKINSLYTNMNYSQLEHILQEIKMLVAGLRKCSFLCVRRFGNSVVHFLTEFTKSISDDIIWIKDPPLSFDVNVLLL